MTLHPNSGHILLLSLLSLLFQSISYIYIQTKQLVANTRQLSDTQTQSCKFENLKSTKQSQFLMGLGMPGSCSGSGSCCFTSP